MQQLPLFDCIALQQLDMMKNYYRGCMKTSLELPIVVHMSIMA